MKHTALKLIGLATFWALLAPPALAQLPQRDLTVELRQVEDTQGITAGTEWREPMLAPQQIRVRNGAKASLSLGRAMPMQWVQSAVAQSASLAASGASASSAGGGVVNAVTWVDAGQGLTVQARWPGAQHAVTVDIEVQAATVGDRVGAELPTQSRSRMATTVSAPLGQWVTIATTGSSAQPGVYGSEATAEPRRLLQLRVLAP